MGSLLWIQFVHFFSQYLLNGFTCVEQKELALIGFIFGSRGCRMYGWLDSLLGATSSTLLPVIGSSCKPWQTLPFSEG